MARLLFIVLALLLSLFVLEGYTAVPPTEVSQADLATLFDIALQDSPADLASRTLTKRHNWVFTCYAPGPDGKAGQEDIKLSRRCVDPPYGYFCDGINGKVITGGRTDNDCSRKCRCEKKLTDFLPICQILHNRKMGTNVC